MHPTAVSDSRSDGYMSLPQDPVVLDASMDDVPPVCPKQAPCREIYHYFGTRTARFSSLKGGKMAKPNGKTPVTMLSGFLGSGAFNVG